MHHSLHCGRQSLTSVSSFPWNGTLVPYRSCTCQRAHQHARLDQTGSAIPAANKVRVSLRFAGNARRSVAVQAPDKWLHWSVKPPSKMSAGPGMVGSAQQGGTYASTLDSRAIRQRHRHCQSGSFWCRFANTGTGMDNDGPVLALVPHRHSPGILLRADPMAATQSCTRAGPSLDVFACRSRVPRQVGASDWNSRLARPRTEVAKRHRWIRPSVPGRDISSWCSRMPHCAIRLTCQFHPEE